MVLKIALLLVTVSVSPIITSFAPSNTSLPERIEGDLKILSRRKRFLIFPDGSSFQVVFCTQNHGYLQIGDVVWFGTTAALAWELPTDSAAFDFVKSELRDKALRRQDGPNKHIYYLDEVGKVIAKVPYRRKPIVNPAFAKRSIHNKEDEQITITKDFIKNMHEMQKSRSYLYIDEASANFQRKGRHGLYKKLKKLLKALGMGGQDCILRMLCEAGKTNNEQGTFLEEIFIATFTLPKRTGYLAEEEMEYDRAHNAVGDCATLYPECEDLHPIKI